MEFFWNESTFYYTTYNNNLFLRILPKCYQIFIKF